jgi:hypothetical protein
MIRRSQGREKGARYYQTLMLVQAETGEDR